MNKIVAHISSLTAMPLSLRWLRRGEDVPVLLPFYHLVSDRKHPFQYNYEYPSVERFEADLDFLLKNFKPISLKKLYKGKKLDQAFHLTFDDGLRECYEIVAPILKRKGIPATFFVNPAFVDNHDLFHRYKVAVLHQFFEKIGVKSELQKTYADLLSLDQTAEDVGIDWNEYLDKEKPYMTLEQLQQLKKNGFTIGAHSWDHPEFWLLDEERQLDEIRESMEWLEANLAPEIKAFAFPFTDFGVSNYVFEAIRRERLCDITFGTAGLKSDTQPKHFQRLPMESATAGSAKKLVKTEYLAFKIKKLFDKHVAERS